MATRIAATAAVPDDVARRIEQELPSLQTLYRQLHQKPELSFQESETGIRIADELARAGATVTRRVGGHGVVGVITNGPGPVILLRSDLDGLPVREQTGLSFASGHRMTNDLGESVPTMHACGHDIHMGSLVGSARVLSASRSSWKGTVIFLGQPAEERGGGARAMLKDGLFERFPKPTACVALHCNASLLTGNLGFVEGFTFANVDSVDITVRGVGGHGAYPHLTKDPIVLASQIVLALQTVVSRETRPGDPAVVTVGAIHGGSKHNIIPDSVHLQLTLRSYTEEVRQNTLAAIRRICKGLADGAGLPPELHPQVVVANEFTPALFNDPKLTERLGRGHPTLARGIAGADLATRHGRRGFQRVWPDRGEDPDLHVLAGCGVARDERRGAAVRQTPPLAPFPLLPTAGRTDPADRGDGTGGRGDGTGPGRTEMSLITG